MPASIQAMGAPPTAEHTTETQLNIIYNQLRLMQQNMVMGNLHFKHYLTTDLSRAKAIFAYGYATSATAMDRLKRIEKRVANEMTLSPEGLDRLSDCLVLNDAIQGYATEWEAQLTKYVSSVAAIKARSHRVDIRSPMSDLIHGKLDSDNDGVGDHIQLP